MTDYTGSNTPADQRDLWRTPPSLFASLDAEFCFQLDAAAAPHNALCRKFITAEQNTLETPWVDYLTVPGYVWLNPHIGRLVQGGNPDRQRGSLYHCRAAGVYQPGHR